MSETERQSRGPAIARPVPLEKAPSGIPGFDAITHGGLPRGRTSLICGSAGSGKTLFGMQFLISGIQQYDEPGVFVAFEETEQDLIENFLSLDFDLQRHIDAGMLSMDHIRVDRSEIVETGEYNLEGLFLRLELAIRSVGARRVVIDTLETLFGGLDNYAILRTELRRLFNWLKERGVSAVVTAERGDGTLTRHGLEEYVSDCVVLLDHRVSDQISTRRLRVVKYRGSAHATNEFPFLIDAEGITVMPITSLGLEHAASTERVSTGVAGLDQMLGGGGYFKGSTVLLSGTAGAGKTSLNGHFADRICADGGRCLYFAFEESPDQIKRNLSSIGLDLARHEAAGGLRFVAARPTAYGLENHLTAMYKAVQDFSPDAVVVDPVSTLLAAGLPGDARLMVVRLVDMLKSRQITAVLSSLTRGGMNEESTEIAISSIVDTWLLLQSIESRGERNRAVYVLKSRGMAHSNQIREFEISNHGVDLMDVSIGHDGVLTGSARILQEVDEQEAALARQQEIESRRGELERRRAIVERQIEALRLELESEEIALKNRIREDQLQEQRRSANRELMLKQRQRVAGRGRHPGDPEG